MGEGHAASGVFSAWLAPICALFAPLFAPLFAHLNPGHLSPVWGPPHALIGILTISLESAVLHLAPAYSIILSTNAVLRVPGRAVPSVGSPLTSKRAAHELEKWEIRARRLCGLCGL